MTVTLLCIVFFVFFFNDTATTEIYTLSLHDALPIFDVGGNLRIGVLRFIEMLELDAAAEEMGVVVMGFFLGPQFIAAGENEDRKSTRLNSSHLVISYAVFCLKKKQDHSTSSQVT